MTRAAGRSHPDASSPERALRQMRNAVRDGRYQVHPRVFDRLLELGLAHQSLEEAVKIALSEIGLAHYTQPDEIFHPPGHAFVWQSPHFGCRMYLKFRVIGARPVCWLYSLHPSDY